MAEETRNTAPFDTLDECVDRNERLSREIATLRTRERKLMKRLYYHEKTGLPNHTGLNRDLKRLCTIAGTRGGRFAVLFVALDATFDMLKKAQKSVLSEWVLYQTAKSIRGVIHPHGRVYQTKSNEFAVVLTKVADETACREYIDRIASKTAEMHRFPGQSISIGCNIGCAVYPEHGDTSGSLLRNADIALSFSVDLGRTGLIFDASMRDEISERVSIQEGILSALEEQARMEMAAQFRLEYQPLVRVLELNGRGLKTRTIGSECLLRWHHPERGLIGPDRFIPLAEENGLIIPIGNWIFYRAADQIGKWRNAGHTGLYLSVNLSPVQFGDANLVGNIRRLLERQRLAADALQIEITETAVMEDPDDAFRKIDALHEIGVRMSIDDFGTGYSSLGYLKNLRVDTLKIDKSFIDSVVEDTYDQGIVRAIISMARGLGIDVLAEGIERLDQVELLYKLGCHKLQGYYFAQPLSEDAFERFLVSGPAVGVQ